MAKRLSVSAVISYFRGEEGSEVLFDGSDEELGMEDEEPYDDEPSFKPLEVDDDLELVYMCTGCKKKLYTCKMINACTFSV